MIFSSRVQIQCILSTFEITAILSNNLKLILHVCFLLSIPSLIGRIEYCFLTKIYRIIKHIDLSDHLQNIIYINLSNLHDYIEILLFH